MQDAVGLIGKQVRIKELSYKIVEFWFVPGTDLLYVGLQKADKVVVNWRYEDLLPYLTEQIYL